MTEKCFCHLNGYKVKDSEARKQIKNLGLTPQMFGAVGDGLHDDSTALYTLFDNITDDSHIVFPKGHYVIKEFPEDFDGSYRSATDGNRYWFLGIENKKNVTIDLNDSIIELKIPSTHNGYGFPRYSIFNFINCENFAIKNGVIIGDRIPHNYTIKDKNNAGASHEWGCGVKVIVTDANTDVCSGIIKNLKISEITGDGVVLYNGSVYAPVKVDSCDISKTRRHGIVIGDTNNIEINNCYIHHIGTFDNINGISGCGMGIDIEAEAGNHNVNSVKLLNTVIEETDGYSICCASIGNNIVKYTVDNIYINNCSFDGVISLRGCVSKDKTDDGNYIFTPVLIKNSLLNHNKYYENATKKLSGDFTNKMNTITNGVMINCVVNSCEDDEYYTKSLTYSIISSVMEIHNSIINLKTPNAKLRYVILNNCKVNGGLIQSYEQSQNDDSIRDCNNVLFDGCKFQIVGAKKLHKFTNCTFKNCSLYEKDGAVVTDTGNLALRNCYLETRVFTKGDYVNCTIEDELT